jgi:hypothetical protein
MPLHDDLHRVPRVTFVKDDVAATKSSLPRSGDHVLDTRRIQTGKQERLLHAETIQWGAGPDCSF